MSVNINGTVYWENIPIKALVEEGYWLMQPITVYSLMFVSMVVGIFIPDLMGLLKKSLKKDDLKELVEKKKEDDDDRKTP